MTRNLTNYHSHCSLCDGRAPMEDFVREAVRRGLEQLTPEYREILLLREINGLSYDEIGRALNLEDGTVKSRIFRARKKLCEILVREGNIPGQGASNERKGGVNA